MIPLPDNLLINLKILSKIQKNGRIARSYDGIISLESDKYYQPIKRFLSSDSRKQAIFEINSIVSESISTVHTILNSKYMGKHFHQSEEFAKNCENLQILLNEMELGRNGIINLKFTYQNDQNIVSQLDIIILKLNTAIKDVNNKLSYLNSILHNNCYYQANIRNSNMSNSNMSNSNMSNSNMSNSNMSNSNMSNSTDTSHVALESIRIDQTPLQGADLDMSEC